MPPPSSFPAVEAMPSRGRVHILGAGPVGLLVTALLQSTERFSVHLYEKRRDYTRTRMVQLASYLVADSVASYCTDYIDEESVVAIFDPSEIDEGLTFRRSIPSDLMGLLRGWTQGFCPLNAIERSLSDLIDSRQSRPVERTTAVVTAQDAMAMVEPGDILIDCTGTNSVLRNQLVPSAGAADGEARTRSRSGSNTRSSSPSCTARRTTATSIASTPRTSTTRSTSSFRPSTARTTTAASPTYGHRQHLRRGLRADAVTIRRGVAS